MSHSSQKIESCHLTTYYELLEVPIGASAAEIKKAYKQKALQVHPDKTKGKSDEFLKLQKAYEVLNDPDLRIEYDNQHPEKKSKKKKDPYPFCKWIREGNIFTLINFKTNQVIKTVTKKELDDIPFPFNTLKTPATIRVIRCKLQTIKNLCLKTS